jgi:polar amino acid transport system substrate-binding protein
MKIFKYYLNSCFAKLTIFWLFFFNSNLWADSDTHTPKKLRFAIVYVEEPPFIYTSDKSKYTGVVAYLAQALSRELDLELEFAPTSRKGLETTIIDGHADATWLAPEWVNDKENLIFSEPVLEHDEFLYSLSPLPESEDPVNWVKDKTICIRQDYQYPSLRSFFISNIAEAVKVSSQTPLLTLLLGNRCDLVYMNEHRANWMLTNLPIESKVFRSSKPLHKTHLALMLNKTWLSKMAQVNQALAKIKDSGELAQIMQSQLAPTLLP